MDWPCSCKNSELAHYIPKCLNVANLAVAIKSSAHFFELVSMHNCIISNTVIFPNDSSLLSRFGGCLEVITTKHSNSHLPLMPSETHCSSHSWPNLVA